MSSHAGPSVVTSGLIFSCDTGNTQKSMKGAPTTNLITNGNFSNGSVSPWGSYNVTPTVISSSGRLPYTGYPSGYLMQFISTTGTSGASLGVSGLLSVSSTYSFSFWHRCISHSAVTLYYNNQNGGGDTNAWSTSFSSSPIWQKHTFTFTYDVAKTTLYFYAGAAGYTCQFADFQIEQKSFSTPYTDGTRSNTQALIDLTGNNILTASSLTYAANNVCSFNGSSDLIIFPENSLFNTQTPTVEVWVKPTSTAQNGFWFEKGTVNSQYALFLEGGNITWRNYTTSLTSLTASAATYLSTSAYNQVVGTYTSGTGRRIYVNGVQVASDSQTGTINTNASGCSIGVYGGYSGSRGYYYSGDIGIVRVYNKALTSAEVMQNFNSGRSRYGL